MEVAGTNKAFPPEQVSACAPRHGASLLLQRNIN
jgi:hypothetical protein